MPESVFPCPHCGGQIRVNPGSPPRVKSGSNQGQIGFDAELTNGFELQDQSPKGQDQNPRSKTYNQGYNGQFLVFWEAYPRKVHKRKAQIEWVKSVKRIMAESGSNRGQSEQVILAGAIRLRDDPNLPEDHHYIPHAATWLNADGWEDEPHPTRIDRRREPLSPYQREERDRRELERWAEGRHDRPE